LPDRRDVVPVFYGTDRKRADKPNRIAYGSDRAKRLELGWAFVTIPSMHDGRSIARPWLIKIPFFNYTVYEQAEDPAKHFTISQISTLSREDMLRIVADRLRTSANYKDHALVFIHGYNNDFDHALYRTAQIAYDLGFDGAPFMYSWPSGGSFTTYTYDRESAQQAEQYLREFIDLAVADSGAKHVSVIAHSMGNQPLLRVLSDLKKLSPAGPRIHQIILAAPDVDRDAFEYLAAQIKGVSKGITLYASSNDLALGVSRRFAGGVARAGDVPEGGPSIVPGIDTIDISTLNTAYLAMNHSTYAEQSALLEDIERLLRTGTRPPDRRLPILKRIASPAGDFWRYP
jgi:esterase/lipase superfamily enzyme